MRKLFLLVFCLAWLLPVAGHAGFLVDPACAIDTDGGTNWFWYCGEQNRSCKGNKQKDRAHYVLLTGADDYSVAPPVCSGDPQPCPNYDRKAVHHGGHALVCCGGTGDYGGTLKDYDPNNWLTTKTENILGVGNVTYYTNPCGTAFHDEWQDDGTIAKVQGKYMSCPVGQTIRTIRTYVNNNPTDVDRCVTPCSDGYAFDGESSEVCVECKETKNQGVDKNATCVRCASDEFFKSGDTECTGRECCVKKNTTTIISREAIARCWRCPLETNVWRACVKQDSNIDSEYKTKCGLAE